MKILEEKNRKKQWEKQHYNEVHAQHPNKEASNEVHAQHPNKEASNEVHAQHPNKEASNEVHAQHLNKEVSREKDLLLENEARKLKYQEDKFNEQDERHKEILERYEDKNLLHNELPFLYQGQFHLQLQGFFYFLIKKILSSTAQQISNTYTKRLSRLILDLSGLQKITL